MIDPREHGTSSTPAPGDLEVLQRFANLHVHDEADRTVEPPLEMVRAFLVERGLLTPEQRFTDADREKAIELARAFHELVRARSLGEPASDDAAAQIDRASQAAGLHPHLRNGEPVLVPSSEGASAALGRLVAIAFLAQFDGTWDHLKECADETCKAIFYDRSKNHSGRWCSMAACGNRSKVRAWRERQRADDDA